MLVRFGTPLLPYPCPGRRWPKEESITVHRLRRGHATADYCVSGAYGGPSPVGFQLSPISTAEFSTIPAREDHEVAEGGRWISLREAKLNRGDITRLVQASLVLSPEAAIRFGNWLTNFGTQAREAGRRINRDRPRRAPTASGNSPDTHGMVARPRLSAM